MTGNHDKLINFVSKFIGTVRFGNDYFASIIGYRDLQMGNILISRVYYVERHGHNLFSVGQFCDSDLEVAFRKHTCYVCKLEGIDLFSRSCSYNLYTISMADMMKSSPICLLFKASKTKSWLWNRRLSHLNFYTINQLAKQGLVKGLPKLKYTKDHLCLACQMGKSKKESHPHTGTKYRKPELKYLHVFDALCYPTNNFEDLGTSSPKADIGIFIWLFTVQTRCLDVVFVAGWLGGIGCEDGLVVFVLVLVRLDVESWGGRERVWVLSCRSLEPALHELTPAIISSGLMPNRPPSTPFVPPSRTDWDILFQPLFDEIINPPSSVDRPTPEVIALIAEVVAP
ncbi:integrase, catalytic region, zinc finger, CCHC-type containing protein [Tanacetum coccineum]